MSWLFLFPIAARFRQFHRTRAAVVHVHSFPDTILVWKAPFWNREQLWPGDWHQSSAAVARARQANHPLQTRRRYLLQPTPFSERGGMKRYENERNNKTTSDCFDNNVKIWLHMTKTNHFIPLSSLSWSNFTILLMRCLNSWAMCSGWGPCSISSTSLSRVSSSGEVKLTLLDRWSTPWGPFRRRRRKKKKKSFPHNARCDIHSFSGDSLLALLFFLLFRIMKHSNFWSRWYFILIHDWDSLINTSEFQLQQRSAGFPRPAQVDKRESQPTEKRMKEEQSKGLLTSSGDCARASSVCKDPKLFWFNL